MNKTKSLVFTALCGALLGLLSQISLPLPSAIPLTVQTFAVALCCRILGAKRGCAAVALWLVCGGIGLPFFAGFRGGIAVLFGPTGGFLLGFLPMGWLCGRKNRSPFRDSLWWECAGLLACHTFGVLWFSAVSSLPLPSAFLAGSAPYLLKDVLCLFTADWAARIIRKKLPPIS